MRSTFGSAKSLGVLEADIYPKYQLRYYVYLLTDFKGYSK